MENFDIRFGGIQRLYGLENFEKIQKSHVCVIGLGGVGSWTVEALARTGVGKITLVDFDDICVSNTNRQLHAQKENVGKMKTQALKERILLINPEVEVETFDEPFGEDTEESIFKSNFSVVVDSLDHNLTKFILVQACSKRKIPVVMSGSAGGRSDFTKIEVGDISLSREDAMLASIRKKLRQRGGFPRKGKMGIPCVFSGEKTKFMNFEGCITYDRPENFNKPLDCATGLGTATHVTGGFGFALADLAVQALLKAK